MIEILDTILNQYVSILIDPRDILSYISPYFVEKCELKLERFRTAWLVKLETNTKIKVTSQVRQCPINLNDCFKELNLNILPIESYDVLLIMDCLERYGVVLNFLNKIVSFVTQDD